MEVRYLGWKSFKIREKGISLVVNPFNQEDSGVIFPKTKAEIVLLTPGRKVDQKTRERIKGGRRKEPFWIEGVGEYEVSEVEILGFEGGYWWRMGDMGVVYFDGAEEKMVKRLVEEMRPVDLALIRADSGKPAKTVVQKLSPGFLVPFAKDKVKKEVLLSLEWAKEVLDLFDQEGLTPLEILRFNKQTVPEESQIVILKPKLKK